jgi:hypothetical protein
MLVGKIQEVANFSNLRGIWYFRDTSICDRYQQYSTYILNNISLVIISATFGHTSNPLHRITLISHFISDDRATRHL